MKSRTQELVEKFHEKFGHQINGPLTTELVKLRTRLIEEESTELQGELWTCIQSGGKITPNLLKEMGDLQYVLDGLAVSLGVDLSACTELVHASNMSKLGENGEVLRREDGKVLKGPNYFEPDMTPLLPKKCHAVDLGDCDNPPEGCEGIQDGCCCQHCCSCGG